MSRKIHIGIYLILIAIAGLLVLEGALRLMGFYKTYTEKMDGKYVSYYDMVLPTHYWKPLAGDSLIDIKPEYTYHSKTNNYGFRDEDFDTTRSDHHGKILVLGDSFVQGLGAPADSTWPHLLQALLNKRGNKAWTVYNCGASGSDPFFEYEILKDSLLPLHPDLVIMSINYSDINDCITRGGLERFRPDGSTRFARAPWFEPLYRHVHLIRMFIHFVLRYDFSLLSHAQHEQSAQAALGQLSACADSTRLLCASHGAQFLVVLHPYLDPYDRYLQKQNLLPGMVPLLQRSDVNVVNLFDDFKKVVSTDNYQLYSWPRDMHYTSRGYGLFAYLLLERISRQYPYLLDPKIPVN